MAVASLVLGILAIILCFTGIGAFVSVILGLIGLILGIIAVRRASSKGVAIGGIVTSAIGLVVGLLLLGAGIVYLGTPEGQQILDEAMRQTEQMMQSMQPTIAP